MKWDKSSKYLRGKTSSFIRGKAFFLTGKRISKSFIMGTTRVRREISGGVSSTTQNWESQGRGMTSKGRHQLRLCGGKTGYSRLRFASPNRAQSVNNSTLTSPLWCILIKPSKARSKRHKLSTLRISARSKSAAKQSST